MYPTREAWGVVALPVYLVVLAIVFARPIILAGAVLVSAWLVGSQHAFVTELGRSTRSLSVAHSPARSAVRIGSSVPVTTGITLREPTSLRLGVSAGYPTASKPADGEPFDFVLEPGATSREQTIDVTWPIAGRHRFDPVRVAATDGLFRETLSAGDRPVVTVEPRKPRTIHVGVEGDRFPVSYGEHTSDQSERGIEPDEIREYIPGESVTRIDWKATARLNAPHVRTFDTVAERRTLLVFDHRASLADGRPSEMKLDYLRNVALTTMTIARDRDDPIGLLTVGDEGITTRDEPTRSTDHLRRTLLNLEPTDRSRERAADRERAAGAATATRTHAAGRSDGGSPPSVHRNPTLSSIRRSIADLSDDTSSFARTLRPFYADQRVYRHRIGEEPLFNAVRTVLPSTIETPWTVIFTDDTAPAELRDTVTFIRQAGGRVTVFLAPTVLYDPDALVDLEQAYDRYLAFDELRRDLARVDGVTILEVGPDDRLSTILDVRSNGGTHA